MSDDCIFCRIARGDIQTAFVAQNDEAVAFRDVSPKAPFHVLVIPRTHVDSLAAADDPAMLGTLITMAAEVARDGGFADSGYRTVINTGPDGGQSVSHLHVHVLAGRHFEWPPG